MSVYPVLATVTGGADVSEDGLYRYDLVRSWGPRGCERLTFVMLNPSTADARDDDPTIRRCVGFARSHGYQGITVLNLYAYRATKPSALFAAERAGVDVVGPRNDELLTRTLETARRFGVPVVAAWGANARPDRVDVVRAMRGAEQLHHLGLTAAGVPRHPLMLRSAARLERWEP